MVYNTVKEVSNMYIPILLFIFGLASIGGGLTYVMRQKKYFWLPTFIFFGVGVMMLGTSMIQGVKGTWLDTILVIFGMIFVFASFLTFLTIIFMKLSVKKRS